MQNKQSDQPVEFFKVEPEIYRNVVAYLGQLPYEQVAGVIAALTKGTTAIFVGSESKQPHKSVTENMQALRGQVETTIAEEADAYVEHYGSH